MHETRGHFCVSSECTANLGVSFLCIKRMYIKQMYMEQMYMERMYMERIVYLLPNMIELSPIDYSVLDLLYIYSNDVLYKYLHHMYSNDMQETRAHWRVYAS